MLVATRICSRPLRRERRQLGLSLLQRNFWFQAGHQPHTVLSALYLRAGPVQRGPEIGLVKKVTPRPHADNGLVKPFRAQRLADYIAIPVKPALSETQADQQYARRDIHGIFVFHQHAPQHWLDARRLKQHRSSV